MRLVGGRLAMVMTISRGLCFVGVPRRGHGKRRSLVAVPEAAEWDFVGACPLRAVPGLQQKTGEAPSRLFEAVVLRGFVFHFMNFIAIRFLPEKAKRTTILFKTTFYF